MYIEEVPSLARPIVGVSTSTTAFVGYIKRGPMDKAEKIFNFGDFQREFGELDADSEVGYAVQQFFLNGGTEAWLIRTAASDPDTAVVTLKEAPGGADVLTAHAANAGTWGNRVRLDVDYDTTDPTNLFNLTDTEYLKVGGKMVAATVEEFRNLSMVSGSENYAVDVVNDGSKLIRLEIPSGAPASRPAQTGAVGGDVSGLDPSTLVSTHVVNVTAGSVSDTLSLGGAVLTLAQLRSALQARLRGIVGLEKATVELINGRLRVRPGVENPDTIITFADSGGGTLASDLGLDSGMPNVQQYSLGVGASAGAQDAASAGSDGSPPGATELLGNRGNKTGMYALEDDVDIFNILCIPRMASLPRTDAASVISEAEAYCEEKRAFLIVDIPEDVNEVEEIQDWLADNATLRHKNAALYFPRPRLADAPKGYRLRSMPGSGIVAGLYARTDSARGVWKAPAGTEATLRGVQELDYNLTDPENGALNPLAINCLRSFRVYGNVCWGARTLVGSDQQASEWKYIPVRRLALNIEESLYRGTQWVVFEPNDEPLWAQIRLNVGAFMQTLFRQGAFAGKTPREAYFVKCDKETTTPDDVNLGIVNILVGFAPLKPAEFVIIKISQIARQEQS
ncbi:MAG TPA: phage tail sheath C-terminal domain-containing protein [Actinomycetota bacterium]